MPLPSSALSIRSGLCSVAGPNERNDDCLGLRAPEGGRLATKGVAAVIADGVSAAEAGKEAAEICVQGFLNDYYDAPEAWTVATSGTRVLQSLNRWLCGLGQSHTRDGRGYVTTVSALVFKGESAHVFHVGDTRIYRWRRGAFEPLTQDHSFRYGRDGTGLARAMGMDTAVEIETGSHAVEVGDRYLLSSDGVHGFLSDRALREAVEGARLGAFDAACERLCQSALEAGSNDNCSALLLEVTALGAASRAERERHVRRLPFPPQLGPGMKLDGFEILEELQATSRSQTYLAREMAGGRRVAIKTPAPRFEDDAAYLERFIMEGWIGSKLDHRQLVKALPPAQPQQFLYTVLEYIEGEPLDRWMERHPRPDARQVVSIAKDVAHGLRAMHRQEMLHQDLKPSNVILHAERGAVLIDYGSTRVAGIQELEAPAGREQPLGTLGYSAPEHRLGRRPTRKSDLFSLGTLVYEMLTGRQPYGSAYERCQTAKDFMALRYEPATRHNPHVPVWLDGAIRKAVQINPQLRYESYSEFEYDLEHPNPKFLPENAGPFMERHPLRFWKIAAGLLAAALAASWWWALSR